MTACSLVLAALELVAPAEGTTVPLIPDCQRAIITNATRVAREAALETKGPDGRKWKKHSSWRKHLPVVLEWQATAGERGPWEVKVGTTPDLSDARTWLVRAGEADEATGRDKAATSAPKMKYAVPYFDPEIARTYYWRVTSDLTCGNFGHGRKCACANRKPSVTSSVASFRTEDLAPRWIVIEGRVGNFRDLGGRIGYGGRRVRQGMIYRSRGLNDNSIDGEMRGKNRMTVSDVEYLTETLGIRTDLDIRGRAEVAGMNGVSPLGKGVTYINRPSLCYDYIFTAEGKKIMAANFREFLSADRYPILFHCIGGADRTGALGYVLNGVLGVSRQELETDWESTFYPSIPYKDAKGELVWNSETHFDEGFGRYGAEGDSWNTRIELYLLDCGITRDEMEKFRSIMLK